MIRIRKLKVPEGDETVRALVFRAQSGTKAVDTPVVIEQLNEKWFTWGGGQISRWEPVPIVESDE